MKGMYDQLKNTTVITYKPLEFKEEWNKLLDALEEELKEHHKRQKQEREIISNNIEALVKRGKQLNKEIPEEVLYVVGYNVPMGSLFYDKYKEWFDED